MIDQSFIRGSGVTVKLNGSAVGGVLSAVCKRKNNLIKIEEFLTDKPVYSAENPSFVIELKTRFDISDALGGNALQSVGFEGGGKSVEYTGCAVESVTADLLPDKKTVYSVVINAADRSVENV